MNDTSQGISDDELGELLARARLDAPVPHGWHEVVERHDHRARRGGGRRRGWTMAAAATVVAVGCLGLVAALQARSDQGGDDSTAVEQPAGSTVVPSVSLDPLAALSDGDWVVPARLPDGYEPIVALYGSGSPVVQVLVGGDDVAEVTITRVSNDQTTEITVTEDPVDGTAGSLVPVETIAIEGIDWEARSLAIDDRVTLEHLQRVVNGRVVLLSTTGARDVLIEIAAELQVVPDDQLDVPRLLEDDTSTTVATADGAELAAHGVNGVYCLSINTTDGGTSQTCGARTDRGGPVTTSISSQSPAGRFTAGLAEPDVARIEFTTDTGDRVVVEPTDASGSFDQRFWVTDQPGLEPGSTPQGAVITYDDATTATLTTAPDGRWTLTDQRTAPVDPTTAQLEGASPLTGTDLRVRPFGAEGNNPGLGVMTFNVESVSDADSAGDVVLTYDVDLGFDPAGRSGTVIAPEATSDGQLAIEVGCVVEGCLDFVAVNDFRQTSIVVTVRRTATTLEPGAHRAPFELVYDDGTSEMFDLVLWAESEPSAAISDAVLASTGPPQRIQTVLTGGSFAYHAAAAFDSIWVLNKGSGTVTRIDEITGEVLATITVRPPGAAGGTLNRLTFTDDAVFATGTPAVRIDPATNEASDIDGDITTTAIIADNDTVWAASISGPIMRIDADMTVTELGPTGQWVDLAIANGLVWAVEQARGGGRLVAFDGTTGEIAHDLVVGEDINGFAVRLVADDTHVVVGLDTSGGGGRTGQLVIVAPDNGAITDTIQLDSRPEGIVLTPQRIWTSGAVLDRNTLEIQHTDGFGFAITRGPDGSIWGTSQIPNSHTAESVLHRYAPGDLAG